jgi:hypothetical protein
MTEDMPDMDDSGTITASSVMDLVLRRSGFYEGPPWHPNVLMAWTLCGSGLPEVGTYAIEDPKISGIWPISHGRFSTPQFSPSGTPDEIYAPGMYGYAFKGSAIPPMQDRAVNYVYGNAHSVSRVNPLSYGAANNNILGISAWFKIDATLVGTSKIRFHLEEIRYDYDGIHQAPSWVELEINHGTGVLQTTLIEQGHAESWVRRGTITGTGWHFITSLWVTKSTTLERYVFDGVTAVTMTDYGTQGSWPPAANTYAWSPSNTNHGQVIARGPVQFAQIFYQYDTPNSNYLHPVSVPVNPTVKLGLSTLRLLWRPKVRGKSAWDVLRAVAAADMGALYVTEHGVITYDNRLTVQGRQTIENVVKEIGLDEVEELDPETALASIVNHVSWGLRRKHAERASAVFKATKVEQFVTPINETRTTPLTLSDSVQSIRVGSVTYRPAAMGYTLEGNETADWRENMAYYRPDFWWDGFTPYEPYSRDDAAVHPVALEAGTASAALGFVDYTDQDPAHLRVTTIASYQAHTWYAVDDSTPFLHVAGTLVVDDGTDNQDIEDPTSIATYGLRTHALAGGDWIQDEVTVPQLAASLLDDTKQPRPYFESVELVGDPRVQLQDVVQISDPEGIGGPIFASIVGIRRRISLRAGVRDQYAMRTFGAIGGLWIMDDPGFSVMDETTIVG